MRLCIYFILLFWSSSIFAEVYKNNIPNKIKAFVDYLDATTPGLQGGGIAILYKGEVVYKNAFGYAKENTELITEKTLIPLASVSKVVSSAAIALMLDKKQLHLEKQYELPYLKSSVSLKNILGNTTGYRFSGNQDIESGVTRDGILEKMKTLPQPCVPGKCYFYSNICFSLVSEILALEKFSLKYAIDNLTNVLNTKEIQLPPFDPDAHIAFPHIKNKKKEGFVMLPFPKYYPAAAPAAAGIFASIDGMIELYKLLFWYRPDLISKETLDMLYMSYIKADVSHWKLEYQDEIESYYGLGFRIFKPKTHKNKELIFHSGLIAGINSFIGFIPSEDIGIIIILNQAAPDASKMGLNFWLEFWR